jgi:hypothetical protein
MLCWAWLQVSRLHSISHKCQPEVCVRVVIHRTWREFDFAELWGLKEWENSFPSLTHNQLMSRCGPFCSCCWHTWCGTLVGLVGFSAFLLSSQKLPFAGGLRICLETYKSFIFPIAVIWLLSLIHTSPSLEFWVLQPKLCGIPFQFLLTGAQQLIPYFVKSSYTSGQGKLSVYNMAMPLLCCMLFHFGVCHPHVCSGTMV